MRARTFYAEKTGSNVADVDVPVIGGHAGTTILPLFSQARPGHSLSEDVIAALTQRTQDGGTEVVQAKAGKVCVPFALTHLGSHDHIQAAAKHHVSGRVWLRPEHCNPARHHTSAVNVIDDSIGLAVL